MRVGIVCFPSVGGSGVVACELALALARRGHRVHVVSTDLPFRLAGKGPVPGLTFHRVQAPAHPLFPEPLYFLALTDALVRLGRSERLDVLHVHYAVPHAASACLARDLLRRQGCAPVPAVVTTLHGSDVLSLGPDPSIASVTAQSLRDSDALTAVSGYLRQEAALRLRIDAPVDVVPNFVDPEVFRPRPDPGLRRLFAGDGEHLIIHVSNLRPVKRVPEVVRIFALVARKVPARLLVVGEGPELRSAREEAEALGLGERVRFLGRQGEVAPLLAISDLFLFPSLSESFGVAAAEAMACGLPVIASDVGGLREVVVDGVTGYLLPPEDGEGMAARAVALLRDEDQRRRMGEAAARHVRARFTPERVVPLYEDVYLRAVRRSRHGLRMSACGDARGL